MNAVLIVASMILARNKICPCGSRQKFKHCCGAASEDAIRPSNDELQALAIEADDQGLLLGEEPRQRAFTNVLRMLAKLGVEGVPLFGDNAPAIVKRIHQANERLFRPVDMRDGGVHLGFFMFRDLFCRLYVPVIMGSPKIDFMTCLDLSDDQKRWMASDSDALRRFEDQALDLFDFAYGFMEFGHYRAVSERARELIYRSHVQLEAAAATATSAYNYRGTLQSALVGVELALKAGLAANGVCDEELRKKFGHDLVKAATALGCFEPAFDTDLVVGSARDFPDYVQSRYAGVQPDRRETGHILMKCQFIASEVTRAFTDRNLRFTQVKAKVRSYPS